MNGKANRYDDSGEKPAFHLEEYNAARNAMRAPAARVRVEIKGSESFSVWMSPRNIRDNLEEFGESEGLRAALRAYSKNKDYNVATTSLVGEKHHCPHCKSELLWSEDRGAHCDGCEKFNEETDLPGRRT